MSVVIRMMRAGAKKRPFYRIVVADSRRQRDGRFVEILGYYDPMTTPFVVKMDEAKVKDWIAQGAQPSTQAASLFRKAGIVMTRPSRPTSTKAAESGAKKRVVKRARKRKVTERKTRAKATRAKRRTSGAKSAPKTTAKAGAAS
jgi:small subunit ribosomal protein S16